jgi:hypothetical protein
MVAYFKAKFKSNGNKASPCLDHCELEMHQRDVCMDFIVGFI